MQRSMKPVGVSQLATAQFKANPYPFYARMRNIAPVFQISAPLLTRAWLVTRYDDVLTVLKDDRFSKDITDKMPWLPRFTRPMTSHMLNRNPPDHTRLRALVSKVFTPRRVEEMGRRIQKICDDLLSNAGAGGSFDLVDSYAVALPFTVISDLLGIPLSERRRFYLFARGSLPIGAPASMLDVLTSLPAVWLLGRYFDRLFAERRLAPQDDLLSALILVEESGDRLSSDELLGMAFLLLIAGYETTVNLIASGALALLEHAEQRERFTQEPGIRAAAIEELLRFTSPVEIAPPRMATEPVTLGAVTIQPGELVAAVLGSANRDDSQFVNPDTLDLGRDPNRHVALGHGVHYCLGASLARMESRIALTTLFTRYPSLRVTSTQSVQWRRSVPLRGLKSLPVTV